MAFPVRDYLRSPQYIMATAYGHSVQWYASSDPLLVAHAVLRCHRVIHHEPPAHVPSGSRGSLPAPTRIPTLNSPSFEGDGELPD